MAWVAVPGSNSIWEYDNAPTLGTLASGAEVHPDDQYYRANGTVTAGVRVYNKPGGGTQSTYVRCRKVGETIVRGELSKDYYDGQV